MNNSPNSFGSLTTPAMRELARRELAKRNNIDFIRYLTPEYTTGPFQISLNKILDDAFDAYRRGENPCIAIEAPPRHGKTIAVDSFIAKFMASQPKSEIIHATYNQDYANDRGRSVRSILNDPALANLYPEFSPDPNANAVSLVQSTEGGLYIASGMGGALTGRGGNLLIIDDPVKNAEEADSPGVLKRHAEWYQTVFRTRALPRFMIIVIMTRWSLNDLVGFLRRLPQEADPWKFHTFKAITTHPDGSETALDPLRYPIEAMRRQRAGMSARAWSCIFQQNPIPDEGTFFNLSEVTNAITPAVAYPKKTDLRWYVPADFAISTRTAADATCIWPFGVDPQGVAWFSPRYFHKRTDSSLEICNAILDLATEHNAFELILEDGHIFRGIRDLLKQRMRERGRYFSITAPHPGADKRARAQPLRGRIEQKMIRFPDIPFMREIALTEFSAFGGDVSGVHDDVVDACSTGMGRLSKLLPSTTEKPTPPPQAVRGPDDWTMADIKRRTRLSQGGGLVRTPTYLNGKPRA